MKIRLAGFIRNSVADGPGVRSVLFLQGCHRNCPGCHNTAYRSADGGTLHDVDCVIEFIRKNCRNRKLTISGGEPLEQYGAVLYLAKALQADGFDLCLYTGAEENEVPAELCTALRYLKTGPYLQAYQTFDTPFVGSGNQKFREMQEGK